MKLNRFVLAAACLTLVACGGGGENGEVSIEPEIPHNYTNAASTRHSYSPYETGSHRYLFPVSDDVTEYNIGGDLEPRENLRHVHTTSNGIRFEMGASRDGVGVERLKNYETDLVTQNGTYPNGTTRYGFRPFLIQPYLYIDEDLLESENIEIFSALFDSVKIMNDVLPPEFQIVWAGVDNPYITEPGGIEVHLETAASIRSTCGATAVACAGGDRFRSRGSGFTRSAYLYIPDDFDTSEYMLPRKVIVHELLHALGIEGHVDSVEFPDSIMGTSGEYIPNIGHIIGKIDREVLQIIYMSKHTDIYNDWGEWSDTTFHLVGRSDDDELNFGVALFNGLPQPWARGVLPDTDLNDNRRLRGTATWKGNLIGFSGPSPIAGDAELRVRLSTLSNPDNKQDLQFRDISFLNRFENQDSSENSDKWFHTRNIDYKVNVAGNSFWSAGDNGSEQGHVTGAFLGPKHEHMGGTVKRTDMVAAFGGSR